VHRFSSLLFSNFIEFIKKMFQVTTWNARMACVWYNTYKFKVRTIDSILFHSWMEGFSNTVCYRNNLNGSQIQLQYIVEQFTLKRLRIGRNALFLLLHIFIFYFYAYSINRTQSNYSLRMSKVLNLWIERIIIITS